MIRRRSLPVALAALSLLLAFLQRPGVAVTDTKIDLHVDPAGFLGDVASAWSGTADLGHVQGGQYGGYLFPMGPFFALTHWLRAVGRAAALAGAGAVPRRVRRAAADGRNRREAREVSRTSSPRCWCC